MNKILCILAILLCIFTNAFTQYITNYDESKIPPYTLPNLIGSLKGKTITNAGEWMKIRRPEILSLFEDYMYSKILGTLKIDSCKILEQGNDALGEKSIRKQVV